MRSQGTSGHHCSPYLIIISTIFPPLSHLLSHLLSSPIFLSHSSSPSPAIIDRIRMPQSNMMFLPPTETSTQLRPTSCPAPRGTTLMVISDDDDVVDVGVEVEVDVDVDVVSSPLFSSSLIPCVLAVRSYHLSHLLTSLLTWMDRCMHV